jgi:hypothetical protein
LSEFIGETNMRTLILAVTMAFAFASMADASACKDPKTGKFMKCPAPAAATAAPAATAPAAKAGGPHCVKGKACGNSCIAVSKVCHKPA